MLTIHVESHIVQDTSWGGPMTFAVPSGPGGRARSLADRAARKENRARRTDLTVVSLRLLGLVEITQTRRIRFGACRLDDAFIRATIARAAVIARADRARTAGRSGSVESLRRWEVG
jgi:hypothetical protein